MLGSVDMWDANVVSGAKSDLLGTKNANSDHNVSKSGSNMSSKDNQDIKSAPKVTDNSSQLGTDLQVSDRDEQIRGVQIGGGPIRGGQKSYVPKGQKNVLLDQRAKNPQNKGSGWIPPLRAKRIYMQRGVLTKHEEGEILGYPRIYFTGQTAVKVPGIDSKAPNKGFDDKEGCYRFVTHDHIAYRYARSTDVSTNKPQVHLNKGTGTVQIDKCLLLSDTRYLVCWERAPLARC